MATLFQSLARNLAAIKGVKVEATKSAILVNLPVDKTRRQTVKVTAAGIRIGGSEMVVARLVSRTAFIDTPVLVRKALEFNAGRQRFGLCLTTDCDPPALDAVSCMPIDIHDENVMKKLWLAINELGKRADLLERQFGKSDDL
jgi:hypothetical protein